METFPKTLFKFIIYFIKKNFWTFFIIQICALAWAMENVAWPQIIKMTVASLETCRIEGGDVWVYLQPIIYIGAAVWLALEIAMRTSGILIARVIPKLEADVRMTLFNYVSAQSHSYFMNNYSGALANKINDMPRSIHSLIISTSSIFIPIIFTVLVMTCIFAYTYPLFGIIIIGWVCMHFGICLITANKSQHLSHIHAETRSKLAGRIVDSFLNNILVRSFARLKYEMSFIRNFQQEECDKQIEALMYVEKVKIVLGVVAFLMIGVFMTWVQIVTYRKGIISLGDMIFIFQGTMNITMIVWWAGLELPRLFQEIGVSKQALSVVQIPILVSDKLDAKNITINKGKIEFKNVHFRYDRPANYLFKDLSIVINPGEKVGLVGFSGSGKTTFVNLILRYFDIESGSILIDDQDIAEVTQDSLREQIVVIPQEPLLFNRSLLENIRYGNLNATDEEVIAAAKQAHCDEFITKLKDKYHTVVGERGLKISGGQRQRISIARAILKKSSILIMDEATSALDSITESYIQESINEMAKDRTTIIVAHRLSTLADMDRILVFRDGKIVEDGTHDELIELENHYKELWDMQVDGFLPELDDDEEEL